MKVEIKKIGNSEGLILPQELMKRLALKRGQELHIVELAGGGFQALPYDPDFERTNRVHVNTLENLIIFIPSILIFAAYVSVRWAAVLGLVFVVGRAVYAVGYSKAAEKRGIGAGITGLVEIVLVGGSLIGLILAIVQVGG